MTVPEPEYPIDEPYEGEAESSEQQEILGAPTPEAGQAETQRDPQEWVTGDDPATEAQRTYLDRLAREAGEEIPVEDLTKADASEHIDRLQKLTGIQPRSN